MVKHQLLRFLPVNASFVQQVHIIKQFLVCDEETREIFIARCLDVTSFSGRQVDCNNWYYIFLKNGTHPRYRERGGRLLQALFPSIIFALVKEMTSATSMATMVLAIPSSCHPRRRIGAKPPIKQRRRSSNAAWCVSRPSDSLRVLGRAVFTTPAQQKRYHRLLVLLRTLSPRTWRNSSSQPSTPT